MKRFLTCLVALCLACLTLSATDIRDIHTEVWLHKNGNAVVHQRWDVTVTGGTEWYIPIENLGARGIRDLRVFENDVKFEDDGRNWDSDRTLEQKRHRCGIVDKRNGVELCWGQGDPGDHVFDIIYVIDNLIQASADGENDMFNWQFLNDEWAANPQHVSMKINNLVDSTWVWTAGEEGNMGVWVFGCEADYRVEDGVVYIESTEPFDYSSSLIVMMRFDKGVIQPRTTDERSFEQLREDAFLGSDFILPTDDEDDWDGKRFLKEVGNFFLLIGGLLMVFIIIPAMVVSCWKRWTGRRYKKAVFGSRRITGWTRDLPLDDNLCAAYSLLVEGDELTSESPAFKHLMGAYFLRWVHQGLLTSEKDPAHEGRVNLRFTKSTADDLEPKDEWEMSFYKATREAAGRNLILEADEFSNWAKSHYHKVLNWTLETRVAGRKIWNPLPEEERCKVAQFRNFLNDFTLSKMREVPEAAIWQEYLVYAELFGIAEKVSKNLAKLYPEISRAIPDSTTVLSTIHSSSSLLFSAAQKEKSRVDWKNAGSSSSSSSSGRTRYYGGGGHSSHHGGGGHHGGGHGGGSR